MSWKVEIYRAKPNPAGKDLTTYGTPKPEQLLGEWVELHSVGDQGVYLSSLHLANRTYSDGCQVKEKASIYWTGKSTDFLGVGQIARIHTGKSLYSANMNYEDRSGVNLHAFAEKGWFVLNNGCGDVISLWWKDNEDKWHKEDEASYGPNPPEGRILRRSGNFLIP